MWEAFCVSTGDGDIGSTHIVILYHISTTKGNYFVAARVFLFLVFSWLQKMSLTYALKTSGTTYRYASNLFLCHYSELPMLWPAHMPVPFIWHPSIIWTPFIKASSHETEISQFLLVINSDYWVLCLQTSVKLYFTSTSNKSRESETHLPVPASSHYQHAQGKIKIAIHFRFQTKWNRHIYPYSSP